MTLLNKTSAHTLSSSAIELPTYTYENMTSGIIHIGLGAFHRGHQALYTHEVMNISHINEWGITAASLFSEKGAAADLPQQDGLYSVLELNPDGSETLKLCTAINKTLAVNKNRLPLIEAMASPQTRIVSLTITEKGYCLNPADGSLLIDNPLISHDIEHPEHPKSAIGIIVAALAIRKEKSMLAFTVMSCDNCPENGKRTRSSVIQLSRLLNPKLADWIQENVCFPSTMVDRIVPAQNEKEAQQINGALGLKDNCGIVCESFRQWVIEDHFSLGRPAWDSIDGATFVKDVAPYENMKLRMLNGAHSFIAYLGYLGGYETVYQAISNPDYKAAIRHLLYNEVIPSLILPEGVDIEAYADELITRFSNPHIEHHTWQIAMDGSQKIPQRWLHTVEDLLSRKKTSPAIALGIAAWMHYVSGIDEKGQPIDVRDPLAEKLRAITQKHKHNAASTVQTLLSLDTIFNGEIAKNIDFENAVFHAYQTLQHLGARQGVATLLNQQSV